ncbi:MAG: tetraacyldisaccharide 4'-kinase [Rhodobacteraceae bacterium]|nr:tetraacyldisaccharide 4'-kinase [Paracoccaceae bacterium]
MRPPEFWQKPHSAPGIRARMLAPLAAIAARLTARRVARPADITPDVPVICIGNINMGGTGKTPVTIALAERLMQRGQKVSVVTRGHGGSEAGPLRVDPRQHTADMVGDEALLHAAFTTTIVARNRAEGVQAVTDAEVILMDDGHQNPSVAKSLSVVVVDAAKGFGNGRVFPAGPLREPVVAGLARADLLISVGATSDQMRFAENWGDVITIPHVTARLEPLATGMDWAGLRVVAFAGIGDPARFFATLDDLGAERAESLALDDHQQISDALFKRLLARAEALGAQLVCTEKDAVRLSAEARSQVLSVPVRLVVTDWSELDSKLADLDL